MALDLWCQMERQDRNIHGREIHCTGDVAWRGSNRWAIRFHSLTLLWEFEPFTWWWLKFDGVWIFGGCTWHLQGDSWWFVENFRIFGRFLTIFFGALLEIFLWAFWKLFESFFVFLEAFLNFWSFSWLFWWFCSNFLENWLNFFIYWRFFKSLLWFFQIFKKCQRLLWFFINKISKLLIFRRLLSFYLIFWIEPFL